MMISVWIPDAGRSEAEIPLKAGLDARWWIGIKFYVCNLRTSEWIMGQHTVKKENLCAFASLCESRLGGIGC